MSICAVSMHSFSPLPTVSMKLVPMKEEAEGEVEMYERVN
jgi:hypothetical protein